MRLSLLLVVIFFAFSGCAESGLDYAVPASKSLSVAPASAVAPRDASANDQLVPYAAPINYPADWVELTRKRQSQ